jgi:hypothetical protein
MNPSSDNQQTLPEKYRVQIQNKLSSRLPRRAGGSAVSTPARNLYRGE